jgi:hypothetical protein
VTRSMWITVGLLVLAGAAALNRRRRSGRCLLALHDRPAAGARILGFAWLAVSFAAVWLPADWLERIGPAALLLFPLVPMVFLAILLLYSPPPPGSLSFHEKGLAFYDGQRTQFVPWGELERFEWNGDTLLLYRQSVFLGDQAQTFGFEVPPERRSEAETIVAAHLQKT